MNTYDEYESFIVFSDDFTEEQKNYAREYMKNYANSKKRLCVIYHPNCGCKFDQFVVLDRYPMSEKIIHRCQECKKGFLLEISDPIQFHSPLLNEDYSLEELKKCIVPDGPQKQYIEAYQNSI